MSHAPPRPLTIWPAGLLFELSKSRRSLRERQTYSRSLASAGDAGDAGPVSPALPVPHVCVVRVVCETHTSRA